MLPGEPGSALVRDRGAASAIAAIAAGTYAAGSPVLDGLRIADDGPRVVAALTDRAAARWGWW
jgi:hypothetical protein